MTELNAKNRPEIMVLDKKLCSTETKIQTRPRSCGRQNLRVYYDWADVKTNTAAPLFITSCIANIKYDNFLTPLKEINRPKFFLFFQEDYPVQAVVDRITRLNVKDEKRLHCVSNKNRDEKKIFERFLLALSAQGHNSLILDARWEGDTLVVVSPKPNGFHKLYVPMEKLKSLSGSTKEQRDNFDIDEDGLFMYWPDLDVHLGWEQFEQTVDEDAALKARQESQEFNRRYGIAIKTLRKKMNLRQEDVNGLTPRQVGRIESGRCRATRHALSELSKAHNMNVSDYMTELSKLL